MPEAIDIETLRRTFDDAEGMEVLPPLHPGEILREEIGISTDTALRLARYFRTSHEFWTNLQARFESETLLAEIAGELAGIEPVPVQAEAA